MRFQDGVCVDMCAEYFRCSGCPSLTRLLFLLFHIREASKPYVFKGPSMKQYGMVPIQLLLLFYTRDASKPCISNGPSIKQY